MMRRLIVSVAVAACLSIGSGRVFKAENVSLTQGQISGTITFTSDFVPTGIMVYAGNPLTESTRYESQVAAVLQNTSGSGPATVSTWSYTLTVEALLTHNYFVRPIANVSTNTVAERVPFPDLPSNGTPLSVAPQQTTSFDITYSPVIVSGTVAASDLNSNPLPLRSIFINAVDSTPEQIQPDCVGSINFCLSAPQVQGVLLSLSNPGYELYLKPGRSYQLNSQAISIEEDPLGNGAYNAIQFNDGQPFDATSLQGGAQATLNYTFNETAEISGQLSLQTPAGWTVYNQGATAIGTSTSGLDYIDEFFPAPAGSANYILRLFNILDLTKPISIAPNFQLSADGSTGLFFPSTSVAVAPGTNSVSLGETAGVLTGKFMFFPPYQVTNFYPNVQVESAALGSAFGPFTPDSVNGGSYKLLASTGSWPYWRFGWNFNLGNPNFTSNYFINNYLTLPNPPQITGVNDVITTNFNFNTALLKVFFTAPAGGTLSDPELDVNTQDPHGFLYETGHAEGLNQNNETTGEADQVLRVSDPANPVPFLVNPTAIVNGSRVTFGPFTVTPYPGQVIIVGVPGSVVLTVSSPQPNATSTNGQFTVTGTAGGTPIATITVNGVPVSFSPDATANDPNQVSFTTNITTGTGSIVVVATGVNNGQATDTIPVTVTQIPGSISLSNLIQKYDGTPKPVTATVMPSLCGASLTYNGLSTPPTNVGSYNVVATFTNPNCTGSGANGTEIIYDDAAGGGTFVIGDVSAVAAGAQTFWGAQWAKTNVLTGGPAPSSFKGFADQTGRAPACGGIWTSAPGNSSNPPASIPAYMAVVVSSAISKSGSTISGDIQQIVVIKTNPGYAPDPGHAGTGTIVATVCPNP